MKQVRQDYWVDEELYEEVNREYLASKNPFKWLKSLFKGKVVKTTKMKQVRQDYWVDEEVFEKVNRQYFAERSPLKWLKSLFKGKGKVAEVSKPKD